MQNGDMTHIMHSGAFHFDLYIFPYKGKNLFILQYYFSGATYQSVRDILINISTTRSGRSYNLHVFENMQYLIITDHRNGHKLNC